MSYRDLQGDARAVAEPKEICRVNLQVPQESRDIVRGGLEGDRRIAISRAPMPLLLQRDDPAAAGQDREHFAERDLDGGPAAVKQDERNALLTTVHFVVHVDAVDRGMAGLLIAMRPSDSSLPRTTSRRS